MSSPSDFSPLGPAEPKRARNAAVFDFFVAFLVAVLAYPFPVMRSLLALPVFVASILATIVVGHVLYLTLFAMAWGRTPAMYLLDLGLSDGRLGGRRALVWAATTSLSFWPLVFGGTSGDPGTGLAARLSGVSVVSVIPRS